MKTLTIKPSTTFWVATLFVIFCLGCSKGTREGLQSTSTPKASSTPTATDTPAATTSSTEDGEWVETEISNGFLVVSAPETLVAMDTGDSTIVYATTGEQYAVVVTVGDELDEDPAAALEMLKTMVIQQAGAEEVHSEATTFEGRPAMRFGLKAKDGSGKEIPVEMMTTLVGGNTLVQAAVTDGDHERFFESFELVAEEVNEEDNAVDEDNTED